MNRAIISTALVFTLVSAAAAETGNKKNNGYTYSIGRQEFDGFEYCRVSDELAETVKRLISERKPEKKEDTAWSYSIAAEVFALPARELLIGVCDITGERGCGWGNFLAVVIAKPLGEVKKHLKYRFGADFTKEKRDEEYKVTLRPVLAEGKKPGESILFCDPGEL